MKRIWIVLLAGCAWDPPPPASSPSAEPSSSSTAPIASTPAPSGSDSPEVQIGVGPPVATVPASQPDPVSQKPGDVIHGFKPTILKQIDVGPQPTLLHGYSDCHLGSGAEVKCTGLIDVELLSRDQGPVTSAPSPKDINQRGPTTAKVFRQSLCHDFYVRLKAPKPTKCDVAVHAVVYPD